MVVPMMGRVGNRPEALHDHPGGTWPGRNNGVEGHHPRI